MPDEIKNDTSPVEDIQLMIPLDEVPKYLNAMLCFAKSLPPDKRKKFEMALLALPAFRGWLMLNPKYGNYRTGEIFYPDDLKPIE